jgi:hypothetical protein
MPFTVPYNGNGACPAARNNAWPSHGSCCTTLAS